MPASRGRNARRASLPLAPTEEALTRLRQGGIPLTAAELSAFRRSFPRAYAHYREHFGGSPELGARKREAYAVIEALETVYISEIPRLLGLSAAAIHRRFRLFHDRILH
ncbi:MAG TPA: hypothetical protein VFI25_01700 [Planctomycetota bacterium]|jgi:hypothetical protein|nr:hypothetical protein [Planctomycetota bacterium]